jgi:NAD(P)-dependent dehydrogenase (short-subunit alcohol dehydrogenase family)
LASKGCNLVLNYTSDSSTQTAEDLASELSAEYGIKALAVQASMGSEQGPKHLVEMTKNGFQHPKTGKFQLDIIINNAGGLCEAVQHQRARAAAVVAGCDTLSPP